MICVFLNACYASEIVSLKLISVYLFEMYTHFVPKMHIFSLHLLTYLTKTERISSDLGFKSLGFRDKEMEVSS